MNNTPLQLIRPALAGSVWNAALPPQQCPFPEWSRTAGLYPPATRSVHGRSLPPEGEIATYGSAEWLRGCSGFIVSFLLHTALILGLGLLMLPPIRPGAAITIISQLLPDDTPIDFAVVEIQELPSDLPDAVAAVGGGEVDPIHDDAFELPRNDVLCDHPGFVEPIGFTMPDAASLLQAVGQGTKGDNVDVEGLGAKVEFYGVKATGRRFVFVTDCSSSMRGPPLERLKDRLRESISALPAQAEFYIVFFNDKAIPMPSSACVKATRPHVSRYLEWANATTSNGGTDPSQAMRVALALKPSVVFLLTDGIFQPEPTLQVIGELNARRKVQINTIAIGEQGAEPVLRRIANENRGCYTFVPKQ